MEARGHHPLTVLAIGFVAAMTCAAAEQFPLSSQRPGPGPGLGQTLSADMVEALDTTVFPDGEGLPAGRGTVAEGEKIFAARCAACHGVAAGGGVAPELAYARMGLTSEYPDKTIGSYWPYATTVFDFIRRAMPMDAPGTLSNDETYAVTAYLLALNGLLDEKVTLTGATLSAIRMPNEQGFRWIDARRGKSPPEG